MRRATSDFSAVRASDGWVDVKLSGNVVNTSIQLYIQANDTFVLADRTFAGDGVAGLSAAGVDLRLTQDTIGLPTYQRVTSATDYDEAGFPCFAEADGLDDWLETAAIDLTGTDAVTVLAGVMKTSDGAYLTVLESSALWTGLNGTITLSTGATSGYAFGSRGTISSPVQVGAPAAPAKSLLTGIGKIGNDTSILRVNGVQVASATVDQGTGNYGAHKFYFMRRAGTSNPFKGRFYGATLIGKQVDPSVISLLEQSKRFICKLY